MVLIDPSFLTDPKTESRLPLAMSVDVYVPRDEQFGQSKLSVFVNHGLIAIGQFVYEFPTLSDRTAPEYDSFHDMLNIYAGGVNLPGGPLFMKFPLPDVIKGTNFENQK